MKCVNLSPDPRLVERLEQQLPRQQDLLDEAFYVLVRLLDLAHPQLDTVGERIRQHRDDQQARRATPVEMDNESFRNWMTDMVFGLTYEGADA